MAIEQIGSETIKALKEALTPLAEKLGTTAEATWPMVVGQQKVDAITNAIWGSVLLVATAGTSAWFVNAMSQTMQDDALNWQAIISGGLSLVGGLLAVTCLTTIVEKLLNPQFQALNYFLELIKKETE